MTGESEYTPRVRRVATAAILVAALVTTATGVHGQTLRPMTVDDVIALQSIGDVEISPNGDWLAVVVKRAGGPIDPENADIWLIPSRGGAARNITISGIAHTRWKNPVWSPDGARLAMLAITDDSTVTPYIWDARTQILTRLIDRDIFLATGFDSRWPRRSMAWLDSVTMLCPVWKRGAHPSSMWGSDVQAQSAAMRGWAKTRDGIEPAVSVLESGRDIPSSERPQGELLRIDVRTRASRVVAEGYFWQIVVSPSHRYAALVADAGRGPPVRGRRLQYVRHFYGSTRHTRLAIVRLDSIAPAHWIEAIRDPALVEGDGVPHTWSPDERTLAVVAKSDSTDEYAATAFLVSAEDDAVRKLSDRTFEVVRTIWAGNGTVLALARQTTAVAPYTDTARRDWWSVDARSDRTLTSGSNITANLAGVTFDFATMTDTNQMLGIAGGRLVTIEVPRGSPTSRATIHVTSDSAIFDSAVWPSVTASNVGAHDFFVRTTSGNVYEIPTEKELSDSTIRVITRPSRDAILVAVDPGHRLLFFTDAERTGTFLWAGGGASSRFEKKLALNEHLRLIADAKRIMINYVGADGDSLKGLLFLPIGYTAERRYPLVTCIYGGVLFPDTLAYGAFDKQGVNFLNMNLIPAHGYALLIPSIPLRPESEASDPMIDIPKSVIPAVDEAIRIGIADPTRLGVIGHSYGGYSTYSMITYTSRFKAAVALAGPADLASFYGVFDATTRYADAGYELQHVPAASEYGQFRMGADPWTNLWRYLRNSPYYYADRVQTPVMVIQGDIDYVNIEQGEEFFSALYRMGKRAKFVRYWGESHGIQRSPANTRDMWGRILGWFDEYLNVQPSRTAARLRNESE